ncbi:MAG: RES family NAD+ phosphorylase [Pseudomonadota bacterium]|nr:RES family NAD+ phosphorylase [Pseudomonadota bacterium]
MNWPRIAVQWTPSHRIVASRFPPVGLFDRVADPADLEVVLAIESMTNERIRDELGDIQLVAPGDRISGPGSTPIMAAFTHPNPEGSRFSDGTFGLYYCAEDRDTAIRETQYHYGRFLAQSQQPPIEVDVRLYTADLNGELRDLATAPEHAPELLAPHSYTASQAFGKALRQHNENGLRYPSVRRRGGWCAAVMRPKLLGPARQSAHFTYCWDGQAITDVYQKKAVRVRT